MTATDIDITLPSLADTGNLGHLLGELAEPGDIIILAGPLGAGKTTITQFIGAGLGVPPGCYITSPTFSLMHEYQGRLAIYHMDLYRLATEEEIEELGLLDYIYGEGVTIIEWPDRLGSLMPDEYLEVKLGLQDHEEARQAEISGVGRQWQERVGRIRQIFRDR